MEPWSGKPPTPSPTFIHFSTCRIHPNRGAGPRRAEVVAGGVLRVAGSDCHVEEKASQAHIPDPWQASGNAAVVTTPASYPWDRFGRGVARELLGVGAS